MKILFISHLLPYPLKMGAALRNHGEIKELSSRNIVDVVTFSQKVLVPTQKALEESLAETRKICRGVNVIPIPTDGSKLAWYFLLFLNIFSITPYSVWKFWSRRMAKLIAEKCSQESYDLVHIDTIALAAYSKYCKGAKLVLNHHNVESAILFRRARADKRLFARLYMYYQACKVSRYERIMASKFDLNTCVSDLDAQRLNESIPGLKTFVVPNGTNTDFFLPTEVLEEEVSGLVFVGGMNWFPNLDGIVWFCRQVYPLVRAKMEDSSLLASLSLSIIGSTKGQALLMRELEVLTKEDASIKILGVVEDIRPYLAKAKVFVVPIRVGGGTRLKILDAMSCGKAIVSTAIGAEGLQLVPGQDIVLADSPNGFSDAIVQVYCNTVKRKQLELSARETVEKLYSWNVIGPQQQVAYTSLVYGKN